MPIRHGDAFTYPSHDCYDQPRALQHPSSSTYQSPRAVPVPCDPAACADYDVPRQLNSVVVQQPPDRFVLRNELL